MIKKFTPVMPLSKLSGFLFINSFQHWVVCVCFITALLSFNTHRAYASIFSQSVIDAAAAVDLDFPNDLQNVPMPQANAIYLMALVAHQDPTATCTYKGSTILVSDRLLQQFRFMIEANKGREPNAVSSLGGWTHCQIAQAFTLAKNTPSVWSDLKEDEIKKIDLIMKALAIAGHYGYDDGNDYRTDLYRKNDFNKMSNPNYQVGYIGVMVAASVYFGASELNNLFSAFNFSEDTTQFVKYGFINLRNCWRSRNSLGGWGPILENGGTDTFIDEKGRKYIGRGAGVKNDFTFQGVGLSDPFMLNKKTADWMYGTMTYKSAPWTRTSIVWDTIKINGVAAAWTLNGATSPYKGQPGMGFEFHAVSGSGDDVKLRSNISYVADAWNGNVCTRSFLQEMGLWTGNADSVADAETKMFVGSEDFLHKAANGFYNGSSITEATLISKSGINFTREIWQKTMKNKVKTSATTWQSFDIYPVTGIFTAEFDVVPNNNNINAIIGLQNGVASSFTDQACAVRFYNNGKIEARNGDAYASSSVSYTLGKRYHIRMVVNATTHTYTIYVKPAGETEVILGSDYAFRKEQNSVPQLTGWSLVHTGGSAGSIRATNMQFTNTSSNVFQSFQVSTQNGIFTAEFDAIPNNTSMNGVIGIQNGVATAYTHQACAVRFYNGKIDARNGGGYPTSTLTYTAGVKYHFKLVINIPNHTYSIYVTPQGGKQVTLGTNYAFRTEQSSVGQLTGWSMVSSTGTTTVTDMRFYSLKSGEIPVEQQLMSNAERDNEPGISIYPNPTPANSPLTIDLGNIEGQAIIKITDLKGSEVYNGMVIDKKITVNSLKSGLYMVFIKIENEVFTKKLLVQ